MVLVDTSIWIVHFRDGVRELAESLVEGNVVVHPFVIGELACGSMADRSLILRLLGKLPVCEPAAHDEVLELTNARRLFSRGIGWIDVHLVAAALLQGVSFWTGDRRLAEVAKDLGIPER